MDAIKSTQERNERLISQRPNADAITNVHSDYEMNANIFSLSSNVSSMKFMVIYFNVNDVFFFFDKLNGSHAISPNLGKFCHKKNSI